MANYTAEGNKKVHCNCGHECIVHFSQTTCPCTHCGCTFFVEFYGVVVDKDGNYVY